MLGQFPGVEAKVRGARGTDRVRTLGVSIGLRLPFFDRNRGAIAVEEATRERLRLEYRARLARAEGDVHRLWTEDRLAQADLRKLREGLPELESAAWDADRAYDSQDLTGPVRLGTVDAYLRSAYDAEDRTQGVLETCVALQTVLGPPPGLSLRALRSAQGRGAGAERSRAP
ncbi:MAG: hypothetical protein HZB55_11955 [Deltaproteobacteria bacterium]|nr:hypothetical protein [Deltaproteobacteria bacterium]